MANDALDPGANNDYPYAPRTADGSLDLARWPTGVHPHRDPETGRIVLVDVTPRDATGTPIVPPTIPPSP